MNDTQGQDTATSPEASSAQAFDHQATRLVDATFAETLGLAMHNAITSQMNAQMAASTSVTSACNRILQSSAAPAASTPQDNSSGPEPTPSEPSEQTPEDNTAQNTQPGTPETTVPASASESPAAGTSTDTGTADTQTPATGATDAQANPARVHAAPRPEANVAQAFSAPETAAYSTAHPAGMHAMPTTTAPMPAMVSGTQHPLTASAPPVTVSAQSVTASAPPVPASTQPVTATHTVASTMPAASPDTSETSGTYYPVTQAQESLNHPDLEVVDNQTSNLSKPGFFGRLLGLQTRTPVNS